MTDIEDVAVGFPNISMSPLEVHGESVLSNLKAERRVRIGWRRLHSAFFARLQPVVGAVRLQEQEHPLISCIEHRQSCHLPIVSASWPSEAPPG